MLSVRPMNQTSSTRPRITFDAKRGEDLSLLRRATEDAKKKKVRPEVQVDIEEFYANPICTD